MTPTRAEGSMNGKPWFEAALLAIGYGTLSVLSFRFGYEVAPADRPIGIFIALLVALSLVWTIAAWRAFDRPPRLGFVLITAALFRAIVLPSYPVQEDDLYRYLWDGKVVARGLDPYLVTPKAVRGFDRGKETVDAPSSSSAAGEAAMRDSGAIEDGASGDGEGRAPEPRDELEAKRNLLRAYASIRDESDTNRIILERVNHPDLVTIYPEITQLLFSIVGRVVSSSWGLFAHIIAMKALLGLFDLGIIAVLILLLRELRLPEGWVAIYAWCPLVLSEVWNSGHMDSVPGFWLLFSVAIVVFVARFARESWVGTLTAGAAGLAFGAAVAAKVFALATAPIIGRWLGFVRGGLFLLCGAIVVVLLGGVWSESIAERQRTWGEFLLFWNDNSASIYWLERLAALFVPATEAHIDFLGLSWSIPGPALVARIASATLIAFSIAVLTWRTRARTPPHFVVARVFLALAFVFLFGPLGFPWYLLWSLPLLPFAPGRAWLALPALLSLYYARFWLDYRPQTFGFDSSHDALAFFYEWIVTLEFGVFALLLGIEAFLRRGERGRRWRELGLADEDPSVTEPADDLDEADDLGDSTAP